MTDASDDIRNAQLMGRLPAAPEDLLNRWFEVFLTESCKGKDTTKLSFFVE